MGSKRLLPGNSVKKVIFWKNKPIFTEIIFLLIRLIFGHQKLLLGMLVLLLP